MPSAGSSPRTWGTLIPLPVFYLLLWFIPTDVGNSSSRALGTRYLPVHPHGRGELAEEHTVGLDGHGSSPRTWGTLYKYITGSVRFWFIPTDVGNSGLREMAEGVHLVHPHGRGELIPVPMTHGTGFGSSPRTWGTRTSLAPHQTRWWFIPTDVGNSPSGGFFKSEAKGSSPRTWGTHMPRFDMLPKIWFIPTDVGNSGAVPELYPWQSVHPHGRGELNSGTKLVFTNSGSSPRTWGTPY